MEMSRRRRLGVVGSLAPYANRLALFCELERWNVDANLQRTSNQEFIITKDFFDEESDLHNSNTAMEAFDSNPDTREVTFNHAYLGDFFRTEDR